MTMPLRPGETAVVLDDEPAARDAVAGVLRECGMPTVITTANGNEVLDLIATASVSLVVCDLAMPGMDGVQFVERLAQANPRIPLVLMSGTNDKVLKLVEGLAQELGVNLIGAFKKPVLAADVRRILARPDVARRERRGAPRVDAQQLREALAHGQLDVYYQPLVQFAGGTVLGAEALVRWRHPEHGQVGPDHFIPLAERAGLIFELTRYVAQHAIGQLGRWRRAHSVPHLPATVSINVSPHGVGPLDFPDAQVTLELTETAIAASPEILRFVSRVRLAGFSLAIDDFGTGHSGLEQLRRLPFTSLKLDKSFVAGVVAEPDARAIVEAGIRLGRQLGLRTVAEGVESLEQWATLDALGCDAAQGFWISPPIPADQVGDWAARWSRMRRI
jgi:EAL domain-containing protein (putative c-di-GMP-specific phosphodiesterase class I)/ActR/RegA family two-component response regulator